MKPLGHMLEDWADGNSLKGMHETTTTEVKGVKPQNTPKALAKQILTLGLCFIRGESTTVELSCGNLLLYWSGEGLTMKNANVMDHAFTLKYLNLATNLCHTKMTWTALAHAGGRVPCVTPNLLSIKFCIQMFREFATRNLEQQITN